MFQRQARLRTRPIKALGWEAHLGLGELFGSGTLLHQTSFDEAERAVHPRGEIEIVGGDHGRNPGLADKAQQLVEYALGRVRIEVSRRLVGEKDLRGICDGARNRYALLLSSGELRRPVLGALAESQRGKKRQRALLGVTSLEPHDELRKHDILKSGEFRQEMVELIDEADFRSSEARALGIAKIGAVHPVYDDSTAVGPL